MTPHDRRLDITHDIRIATQRSHAGVTLDHRRQPASVLSDECNAIFID